MYKGNMSIHKTKRYGTYMRKEITKRIVKEWKSLKDKDPSGVDFAEHMLKVLTDAGFKSPTGGPLTLNGVRYQVLRSGIGFRGTRLKAKPQVSIQTQAPAAAPSNKEKVLEALSGIPPLLDAILRDKTVTPEQRIKLVAAYFEVPAQK